MTDKIQKSKTEKDNMSFFDYAIEVIGWLKIVLSPLLAGLILAALIYFSNPSALRLVIALVVVLIALIFGIVLATKIWKKQGTIDFLSRVSGSPDLDNLDEKKK